eukprot:1189746-Prorocentrum_minimum.AAC.3
MSARSNSLRASCSCPRSYRHIARLFTATATCAARTYRGLRSVHSLMVLTIPPARRRPGCGQDSKGAPDKKGLRKSLRNA